MPHSVRCPCGGHPGCRLCTGTKFYPYEPGPHGWQWLTCPTCRDAASPAARSGCVTCRGRVFIDPATPPFAPGWRGHVRTAWKVIFGGG